MNISNSRITTNRYFVVRCTILLVYLHFHDICATIAVLVPFWKICLVPIPGTGPVLFLPTKPHEGA